jgi:hypothetical protein
MKSVREMLQAVHVGALAIKMNRQQDAELVVLAAAQKRFDLTRIEIECPRIDVRQIRPRARPTEIGEFALESFDLRPENVLLRYANLLNRRQYLVLHLQILAMQIEQGHGFESVLVRCGLNAWVRLRRFGLGRRGSHRKRDCSRLDGLEDIQAHTIFHSYLPQTHVFCYVIVMAVFLDIAVND